MYTNLYMYIFYTYIYVCVYFQYPVLLKVHYVTLEGHLPLLLEGGEVQDNFNSFNLPEQNVMLKIRVWVHHLKSRHSFLSM